MAVFEELLVDDHLKETVAATQTFASDEKFRRTMFSFAEVICTSLTDGGKLLLVGNGGSAGDAQHIAGEFVSRLFFDRRPLAAIALTVDTSVLTAIGNDYGYERVFERQVLALGRPGDVLLGISTSGKSPNILRSLEAARKNGLVTLGFAGSQTVSMDPLCDYVLRAPSAKTAIIQQIHIVAAHIICGLVESRLCGAERKLGK